MKVSKLIELLQTFPQDLEVIYELHSDYELLNADDIRVVKAVPQDHYYMRSHPTMSAKNKMKERSFLLFPGD